MCLNEWKIIQKNLTKWVIVPVGALAVLEIFWNLIGAWGLLSLPLWAIKLAIFGYAGYICTIGDDD